MSINELFVRYEKNPIITRENIPYDVNAVFNPGAIEFDGNIYLLCRVETKHGFSHLTLCRSRDGLTDWEIPDRPTLLPDENYSEEMWGLEDPRIVYLEDMGKYAITYVSFSPGGRWFLAYL